MDNKTLKKMNYFLMNKREAICVENSSEADSVLSKTVEPSIVLGFAANLDTWGYRFDQEVINKLLTLSESSVIELYNGLVETLKEIKGDDVDQSNFLFKNFPDSCKRIDIDTLSNNRFVSYYAALVDLIFDEDIVKEINWDGEEITERKDANHDNIRIISLATIDDFKQIPKNLLSSRMSMSEFDKEIIDFAIENFDSKEIIPNEIPFKENWAYIVKKEFEGKINYNVKFDTLTDMIRAAVALSDGDITLSKKPELKKFDNKTKNKLLKKLEDASKRNPDLVLNSLLKKRNQRFIDTVMKRYWHISSEKNIKKFPNLNELIEKSKTMYSNLSLAEQSKEKHKYLMAANYYLKNSAGEFIRRLNTLVINANENEKEAILKLAEKNIDKVAPAVLLNVKNAALSQENFKTAFIKGNTAKVHAFENKTILDEKTANRIAKMVDDSIKRQLSNKEELGNVYIDPNLKECPIPFAGRNNNGKNRSVERGTKMLADKSKNIIRGFCYKKYKHGGFYDLSASFLNDKFSLIEQCSWTQLKTSENDPISIHSGDNSNCRDGLTEFIDVNLDALKKDNINKLKFNIEKIKDKEKVTKITNYIDNMISNDENVIDGLTAYAQENNDKELLNIIQETSEKEIRYVAFQVFAWNGVPFDNMDRVFFGIMERDGMANDLVTKNDINRLKAAGIDTYSINNGRDIYYYQLNKEQIKLVKDYKQEVVFDPATVEHRIDLTGKSLCKIPMMYDVKENKYIFMDLDVQCHDGNTVFINSSKCRPEDLRNKESHVPRNMINIQRDRALMIEDFVGPVAQACYSIVYANKPNLYDLFEINAKARNGNIVDNIEEADIIYTTDYIENEKDVITPFDRDIITADYLTITKENEIVQEEQKEEKIKNNNTKVR